MNDLITKIQSELPGFSKGQKQIARFILEHYDKAAFMTASRLGVTVGVSESTVVRFATELGYDGYPHLQRALQEMIRNKLTSVQRMEVAGDRMGGRDVLQTVLHADTDMIRVTLDEIDRDAFISHLEEHIAELAVLLSRPEGSVLSQLDRERAHLSETLRREHPELAQRMAEHREELRRHLHARYPELADHIEDLRKKYENDQD